MPKIFRNGIEYPSEGTKPVSSAFLSNRSAFDQDGNDIEEAYVKISESGLTKPESSFVNTAAYHNSIYRGKDITSYFTDGSLYTRISSGKFTDIYIGDYFKATINSKEITCRIAGFDIYLNQGETPAETGLTAHHAVIVPDEALMNAQMNSSNVTTGGYKGSAMRQNTIPTVNGYLQTTFGEHLITVRECLSNSVDTSKPSAGFNGWNGVSISGDWTDSKAELMTEVEVYGTQIWGSSGMDILTGTKQLPLFQLAPEFINAGRFTWWLRAVVSSPGFALVGDGGLASGNYAGNSRGVRPRWLIG